MGVWDKETQAFFELVLEGTDGSLLPRQPGFCEWPRLCALEFMRGSYVPFQFAEHFDSQ